MSLTNLSLAGPTSNILVTDCYRKIDLCIISIAVIHDVVSFDDVTQRQQVNTKQGWPKY